MIKGIDVSSYQSTTYSTSGLTFVIVKASEGTSYINPKQWDQAARARKAGLHVGFYHYLQPGNMTAQAKYFVEKCASIEYDSLWADWEEASVSCADKDTFIKEVQRLRGSNHRVGLYCNQNYWLTRDTTSFAGDALWIAQYNGRPGKPSIQAQWTIHQYTSTPIDTNVARFGSKAEMLKWAKKGKPAEKPKEPRKLEWQKVEGYMPELRYGDENWHVNFLQRNLNRFVDPNLKVDSKYGPETAKAVHKFYREQLDYTTTTSGKVFSKGGWRRVLSISDKPL